MRAIARLLLLLLPWLGYSAVLVLPWPASLGLTMRYQPAIALPLLFLSLFPLYKRQGFIAASLRLGVTLILFALPLAGLWNSGVSEYPNSLGGLFPLTDGSNYYTDARRILDGGRMNAVSSSRPLFPGLLAVLLAVTQQNLSLSIALLVAMVAIACHLASRELYRTHGTFAALTLLSVLFLFYRRFLGTVWTENLGVALGAIAMALLWRAIHRPHPIRFGLGLFTLTLALNARAGAFFVLPALILWGCWAYRRERSALLPIRFLCLGLGIVLAGFGLNQLVLQTIGMPELGQANFSYVIYAQVVESTDWRQVQLDYPDTLTLPQPQLTQRIYALTWDAFHANPWGLLRSAVRAIATYLSPTPSGALGFVSTFGDSWRNRSIILGLYGLSWLGVYQCVQHVLKHWKGDRSCLPLPVSSEIRIASFLLCACLGIIASIPLAPPWMDGSYASLRMYAATLPITATLPALGITTLFPKRRDNTAAYVQEFDSTPLIAIALILLTTVGAMATKLLSHPAHPMPVTCTASATPVPIWFNLGSAIRLVSDRPLAYLPNVRVQPFRQGVATVVDFLAQRQSKLTDETRELLNVDADYTVLDALNLETHQRLWVVMPTGEEPGMSGAIALCGQLKHNVLWVNTP